MFWGKERLFITFSVSFHMIYYSRFQNRRGKMRSGKIAQARPLASTYLGG
jgi:hypothetical protein